MAVMSSETMASPQIKVCGLTTSREARACVAAGARAIGFVAYPKSPRFIDAQAMRRIADDLPPAVCTVGVFVNETFERIMRTVAAGGLKAVQLHGRESPDLVTALAAEGVLVIKALFANGRPPFEAARHYSAAATFLVEAAGGPLPGGNAMDWRWAEARRVSTRRPVVLAGGLTPENVREAIEAARPDGVDVSSGVELRPGRKDPAKVAAFCRAVAACRYPGPRTVFGFPGQSRK